MKKESNPLPPTNAIKPAPPPAPPQLTKDSVSTDFKLIRLCDEIKELYLKSNNQHRKEIVGQLADLRAGLEYDKGTKQHNGKRDTSYWS